MAAHGKSQGKSHHFTLRVLTPTFIVTPKSHCQNVGQDVKLLSHSNALLRSWLRICRDLCCGHDSVDVVTAAQKNCQRQCITCMYVLGCIATDTVAVFAAVMTVMHDAVLYSVMAVS